VRGYVRRHVAEADCDDVVAEVFVVAWRKFGDVPEDPVPWLLATARRVVANHWRSQARRSRLETEMRSLGRLASEPDLAGHAVTRAAMLAALAGLEEEDRELLLLVGWDGLDATGVARVFGCSAGAARMRLSRARGRLEGRIASELGEPPSATNALGLWRGVENA
jgi:RNA polymerase sigma-70 factor (ECF subfamily)